MDPGQCIGYIRRKEGLLENMGDQTGRQVYTLKKIAVFVVIMSFALSLAPGLAMSADESYVIGRITGTHQELPGYFHKNPHLISSGTDEVEFTGFRLLREENGKKYSIRPNHDGYFYQDLPEGDYTLIRKRNDRPKNKEPKTIDIMSFTVKPGTMVNLGTLNLILNGEPHEFLGGLRNSTKGTYTYSYRYERDPGGSVFENPFNWFTKKKPDVAAAFGNSVVREGKTVTSEGDGSKVVLEENIRWPDD